MFSKIKKILTIVTNLLLKGRELGLWSKKNQALDGNPLGINKGDPK